MQSSELSKLEANLYSRTPIIGSCIRQRSATALAKEGSTESRQILAEAYFRSEDRNVQAIALKVLRSLDKKTNSAEVDAICGVWERTRNPKLAELMKQQEWVAVAPARIRVLTALKIGQHRKIIKAPSQVVKPLLEAFEDLDPEIATGARQCAVSLQNRETIEYICSQWAKKRETVYEQIILQAGYFSNESAEMKVLTALKIKRLDLIPLNEQEILEALLKYYDDQDPIIRQEAQKILHNLTETRAKERLADAVIEKDDPIAKKVMNVANYLPETESKQALFYFLTDQWEEYLKIDPQREILEQIYGESNYLTKERIRQKISKSKQIALLDIVTGTSTNSHLRNLNDQEWKWLLDFLIAEKAAEHIWYYTQIAPLNWSRQFLLTLESIPWETADKKKLTKAIKLAKQCIEVQVDLTVMPSCQNILEGHTEKITALAISPDNTLIASGSDDNSIRIWKIATGEIVTTLTKHKSSITQLSFTSDSLTLVSASQDKTVKIWPLKNIRKAITLLRTDTIFALSNDGKLLATTNPYYKVLLYKVADGKEMLSEEGHTGKINDLCFSTNNKYLATGSQDKTVKIWRIPEGQLLRTIESHSAPITTVTFSPDNQLLLSGSADRSVKIQYLQDKIEVNLSGHIEGIVGIAVTPDNERVITTSENGTIKVWQLEDGYCITTKTDHTLKISGLVISGQGDFMVSASLDKTLLIWDLSNIKNVASLTTPDEPPTVIALSQDGQWLVTADGNKVRVWTSDFYRLTRTPVHIFTPEDKEAIGSQISSISPEQAQWLELLQLLIK